MVKNRFNSGFYKFTVLISSLFVCCIAFSQKNEILKITDNCIIDKNEKVFVQLDKECYISGEALNFSSVILNASKLNTDGVSKEIYFEVVDNKNQPVMDWHCSSQKGFSSGSVLVPDSISFGIYTLKAYTNWMRNFPADLYFSKKIIITRLNDKVLGYIPYSKSEKKEPLINFFPEGGNLIVGFNARIAYRINKIDSVLLNRLCIIKDNEGSIVSQFNISATGLGSFILEPVSDKSYFAQIEGYTSVNGDSGKFELPKVYPNGSVLKIQTSGNLVKINVLNKDVFLNNEKLKLTGFTRGTMCYDTIISSTANNIHIELEAKRFQPGITEFVLTSGNYVINYRFIYIQPSNQTMNVNLPKSVFNSGEQANFNIDLKDIDTSTVSVSVSAIPHFNGISYNRSFLKYMYFDSEIDGIPAIINSKDYLDDADAELVLLTTKYEDYVWNRYQDSKCIHLKETAGYILKGSIKKHSDGVPLVGSLVTMACIDSVSTLKYSYTDKNGTFLFLLDEYYDNKDIVFQIHGYPRTQNDIDWEFENKDGRASSTAISTYSFNNDELNYLSFCKNVGLVDKVFNPKQKKSEKYKKTNTAKKVNFYGNADEIVHPSDYTELTDFEDIAANIVPGIRFRNKAEKSSMQVYSLLKHELINEDAFVILNGIPYDDLVYISTLGSKLVKRIEVVQSTMMYGDITCSGIVAIYSDNYKIPGNYYNSSKSVYTNEIKSVPLFNFSNSDKSDESPNLKHTLYWNPSLILSGNYNVSFTTSDIKGKYEVSVKGVSKSGKLIEKTAIIEVK